VSHGIFPTSLGLVSASFLGNWLCAGNSHQSGDDIQVDLTRDDSPITAAGRQGLIENQSFGAMWFDPMSQGCTFAFIDRIVS
jgi:hypothetical protein